MDPRPPVDGVGPLRTDKTDLLTWRSHDGEETPITSAEEWQVRRERIVADMELVMGRLPGRSNLVQLDMEVLESVELPTLVRNKVTYVSEPGDRVPAFLMIPKETNGGAPAMLCLHQTTAVGKSEPAGLEGEPNLRYALEMAERGYVTLAPDYPDFGEYSFDPHRSGYASATMKGIWNHMRGIDLLQSLSEVDGRRVGCIGHSLGGHNAIFLGVFDTRSKVTVSSCGFTAFPKYRGGDLAGWSTPGYMPRIADVYKNDPNRMPFDFTEAVAALAPRSFFINAPTRDDNFDISGVRDCVDAAAPVYELLGAAGNLVAAYPDAAHDFPPEISQRAYAFVDRMLKA